MGIIPKFTRKEKGQSLSELALVFALLLLLFTGVIDIGSVFYTYTALQDTTQEGAIFGSGNPTEPAKIADHIKQSAVAPVDTKNITDIDIKCSGGPCVTDINSCQGQKITVTVGYTYHLIMPILPALLGRQTVALKASVTSTILQSTATIAALELLNPPGTCLPAYPYP